MAASCETRYISTACNRTPGSISWGYNNLICFGACNSATIYDPQKSKILSTLAHHSARVNCVRWIHKSGGQLENEFLSASTDKTVALWTQNSSGSFVVSATLSGHNDAVTVVDGIYLPVAEGDVGNPSAIIASASADSTVKIWKRCGPNSDVKNTQTIDLRNGLCLSLRLCLLPGALAPLLAVAADDAKIHLYSGKNCEDGLHIVHSLVGHEDWVRSIDIAFHDNGDLLIASAGQDAFIRIWRLSQRNHEEEKQVQHNNKEIKLEEDLFSVQGHDNIYFWAATVDSVIAGHEGWVYEVCWHPLIPMSDGKKTQPLFLLSASLDKSMVLWSPESDADEKCVWLEKARVGEVGGNTLGFYGCQFSPDGHSMLAHGYHGSFHLWHRDLSSDCWQPGITVGGHFDSVTDLGWEPDGQFIISVSSDQTSRLHAPWVQKNGKQVTWHELARPQVHGYDIQCLAVISRYKYASGAEEKVVRVFEAPGNFIVNFHKICNIQECHADKLIAEAPLGASVPSLGLSNKAVYENEKELPTEQRHPKDEFPEAYFTPVAYQEPPKEEDLLQNTLWPETQKLYGHGYEIYSLAASHDGKLLASACKATITQHAAVILWNTKNWQQLQRLESHELTVTQLVFSPNDCFLLSVSRDRRWSLFQRCEDDIYQLAKSTNKSCGIHTRIIWCGAWTHDSLFFSTGSREGKIVVWGGNDCVKTDCQLGIWCAASEPLTLKESVTSLAFAQLKYDAGHYILAAGLENGCIWLYKWSKSLTGSWNIILTLNEHLAHHLTVNRLAFRPQLQSKETVTVSGLELASAGADHAVKIHSIVFD